MAKTVFLRLQNDPCGIIIAIGQAVLSCLCYMLFFNNKENEMFKALTHKWHCFSKAWGIKINKFYALKYQPGQQNSSWGKDVAA